MSRPSPNTPCTSQCGATAPRYTTLTCPCGGSCSSSSPSTLMRFPRRSCVHQRTGCSRSAGIRSFDQRDVSGLAIGSTHVGDGHLLIGAVLAHRGGDVAAVLDLGVTDVDYDVAALEAGVVGG